LLAIMALVACQTKLAAPEASGPIKALATENFIADMAQNVAGDRLVIGALVPAGVDPHSYEPAPRDVARVADSQALIVNGAGLEAYLDKLLKNAGGERLIIEASAGLTSRQPGVGEVLDPDHEGDPHFWLDPLSVITYVENIRDGLSQADPPGAELYARNAANYIARLRELDAWIVEQLKAIPPERRLLVTNHESFGYFADRYGFKVVGTVLPSVSTEASPSAQQLAHLVEQIKKSGAPAIFLESGANPQLAQQVANEAGVKVVTRLNSHSIGGAGAANYIEMMRSNTQAIADALR
jgi:ABC-type Zn uptake system ZnuABC Zn-binding protein ZnuA